MNHYLHKNDELLLLETQWRTDPRLDSTNLDFDEDYGARSLRASRRSIPTGRATSTREERITTRPTTTLDRGRGGCPG
jgi:hypothetical protein